MKVLLVDQNPHPLIGDRNYLYEKWWGREIELGEAVSPARDMPCAARLIWPIVGPPEFVALLRKYGLGTFACVHCFGEVSA